MIKISTAAKLIGVTRQAIYKHINAGNIAVIEIDGAKFVNRDDVIILHARTRDMRERRNPDMKGEAGGNTAGDK